MSIADSSDKRRRKLVSLAAIRCFNERVRPCRCRRPADCAVYPPLKFHETEQDPFRTYLAPTGTAG